MKKNFSLIMAMLVILSTLVLSACGNDKAVVESLMEINGDFSGHRSITVKYPLSVQIDSLTKILSENNPLKDSELSKFEYLGVEQDGYTFLMDLAFNSKEEYLSQVELLLGRQASSYLAQPSSVLCSGIRMKEDFDVFELASWMTNLAKENDETKSVDYDYKTNTVSVDGKAYNTASTIDISEREGEPINSVLVETTNLKDGTYDRTITISVPNKTYVDLSGSIEEYFTANTSPLAQYCDWTSQGSSWEYKVIYKGLDINEINEYTAMLLDTDESNIYYGDKDNSSTPLSEGLMFEESFNTFSFVSADGKDAKLSYKYALPTKTTHGDGILYSDGKWNAKGSWQDGVYSVDVESGAMNIRIPDGIQYAINGIDMNLKVLGKDDFVRTTEFLYSKTQGMDGMLYAKDFFESKGVAVETDENDNNLICRVTSEGNQKEITDELVRCFGSGNFMAYTVKEPTLGLVAKTKLTDYVNFSYMLNSTNANRPIKYTVESLEDENIIDLSCDTSELSELSDKNEELTVDVKGGEGTITYNGNIPNLRNIAIYCIVSGVMLGLTLLAIVFILKKQKEKISDIEEISDTTLQQTTTFSITELKLRSEKINQKYRDEIDKDIEEKIEADRIETLTKEAKAKELERLTRMVNGENLDEKEVSESKEDGEQDV